MGDPRDGFTFNDDGTPRGDPYKSSKPKDCSSKVKELAKELQDIVKWSDRLGSDEIAEITRIATKLKDL